MSGSEDHTIKSWQVGGAGSWPCLGIIAAHTDVRSLVVWNGRVISGSDDKRIVVHSIASRQHEATLRAHTRTVNELAVSGEKLYSASEDGTICEWALGTWERLRTIRVGEHVPDVSYPCSLAMSGSMLVCGGYRMNEANGFVLVLDTQNLRCEHTLLLDESVFYLLGLRGEVWGLLIRRVGDETKLDKVVVWGKVERAAGASEAGRS